MKKTLTIPDEPQPRNVTRADLVMTEGFLGFDLLAMHVGNRNDIDQCCNGAAVASASSCQVAQGPN